MTFRDRMNAPQPPWMAWLDRLVLAAHLFMVAIAVVLAVWCVHLHAWKALGWALLAVSSLLPRRLVR